MKFKVFRQSEFRSNGIEIEIHTLEELHELLKTYEEKEMSWSSPYDVAIDFERMEIAIIDSYLH